MKWMSNMNEMNGWNKQSEGLEKKNQTNWLTTTHNNSHSLCIYLALQSTLST